MLAVWFVSAPVAAFAQASMTGVIKDSSGAVLPGVTVEASSPTLIEKVRSVITDSTGQYRIVDLRPGTYALTASLTGFSTFRREGIELTGSITVTVPIEMRVGALQETITVTGESPVVDVQSVRRQVSIDNTTLNEIPSARGYGPLVLLQPAIITGGPSNTQVAPGMVVFGAAGGRGSEGRVQVDGLAIGAAIGGSGSSSYVADTSNAQEVTFTNQGGLGEAETGGPTLNVVPRTGGNRVSGSFYSAFVRSSMVDNNYSQTLKAQGLPTPGGLERVWDVNLGIGGPIRKNKLWFFANLRDTGADYLVPGLFPNLNEFNPAKWTYEPDRAHKVLQASGSGNYQNASVRLTLQASQRNKFNVFWDEQFVCAGASYSHDYKACDYQPTNGDRISGTPNSGSTSPEASGIWQDPTRSQQATWSSPATNKLLLEAGYGTWLGYFGSPVGLSGQPGNPGRSLIRVTELCATPCPVNGDIGSITFRSPSWSNSYSGTHNWRTSASYVTGAHNMKFGYQGSLLIWDTNNFTNDRNLSYTVNNGQPTSLTMTLNPFSTKNRAGYAAFYGQEQWTLGRMTLQGALRYDRSSSYFPEQRVGHTTFLPNTEFVYPKTDGVKWNDISPRVGVAYNLFGTGKTSIKVNVGKYVEAVSNGGTYTAANPTSRLSTSTTRSWTDANLNFEPDCDLTNPARQDLRSTGGDLCAQMNTLTFGQNVFTSRVDPDLLTGWGTRGADWAFSASAQHEVLPRTSVEVGYNWRVLTNFTTTDNQSVAAGDFDAFSIVAPVDSRLPDNGGYTVDGLYNVKESKFGQLDNVLTAASNYGSWTQHYNGVLAQINARPRNGLTLQGGVNVGKTVTDSCEVRSQLPEIAATNPYCKADGGFVTRVTALGSYTVPKIAVLVAGTFRSEQGNQLRADWSVPNSIVQPSLGRPLAGGTPFVTVNLIEPGTLYGERVNVFDLRVAKVVRVGRTRTNVGLDLYNVSNSDAVLSYNNSYTPGGRWLAPTSILSPRFLKFSAHVDF
jgi:Carboxypeptidase regulatory-like domain